VVGSNTLGGMNFMDTDIYQGSGNLLQLACQISNDDNNGTLMKISIQWWQYKLGIQENPFQYNNNQLQYGDSIWFSNIHRFINENTIQVKLQQRKDTFQKIHDINIMEYTLTQEYPKKIVRLINRCWLFIGATTLSNITNVQDTEIDDKCYKWKKFQEINKPSTRSK
jgi:hypothetical protein